MKSKTSFLVLLEMIRDLCRYIGDMLLLVFVFIYIFSGFGFFIVVGLLGPLIQDNNAGRYLAILGIFVIVLSWLYFLREEFQRRYKVKLKRK